MYLKSIEVQGFKSFANKIDFQFHEGITAIVGPNGSGKSNVADAVRWVLGEQRIKQLRGSSMQDVIFSGTEMRKPMGYAFVSITLDNSDHALPIDFEEVTVSRRVYRSGESEYLINGATCRLKDVYEMFYDTGIGKEGYSIIGQGQIDKILSGKPEERRELFDEAAGIVKFKRRKSVALKKLEEERANLVRVSDILAELEKQVGPLEKQSEVAKEYLRKKEELKKLDVNIFLLESERIKGVLSDLDDKIKVAEGDLYNANLENDRLKAEYGDVEEQIASLDAQIEAKRQRLSDTGLMREKLEGEINVLKEKINSAGISGDHYKDRVEALGKDIEEKENEKARLIFDKSGLDNEAAELIAKRDEAKASLAQLQQRIEELTAKVEEYKNNIIQIITERAIIKTKLGQFDTMLEQTQIRKSEIQARLLSAKSEEAEQELIIQSLYADLNEISDKILKSDQEKEQLEEGLGTFRQHLEELDHNLSEAQIKYHGIKSKLDTLRNLAERYEGYGGSIRRVMEQKDKTAGIIGVVADIIKVDKKYENAIETALGGNIQNIVTKDEQVAKKMITYLKENKGGRATFLPLTTVRNRGEFDKAEVRDAKGFVGMAAELVNTDKEYADVISQLLGAIIVIDTIDHALALAKEYNYTLRIVTLDGEYLTPGGALAGGAFKNGSNLLGRKREIDALEEETKKALKVIDGIMNDIENTKEERTKVRNRIEQIKADQQELFIQQNTAQVNVDTALKQKDEMAAEHIALEQEFSSMEGKTTDLAAQKRQTQEELKASEESEKDYEDRILKTGKELDAIRDEETAKVLSSTDLELEVSKIKQRQDFSTQNIDRIAREIEHLNEELLGAKKSYEETQLEIEEKLVNIEEIKKTIEASASDTDENETALKEAINKKEELSLKQKNFFTKREEISGRLSALDKELFRLNSQRDRLSEEQESRAGYMWNEYEITLLKAWELRDEELTDSAAIKRSISSLKDQIKKLGDVNVNAIEDYKNLMERYTFTKSQHDDLITAEQDLLGILEELDTQMRRQFDEKFKEIAREFNKVFKELFGGGSGSLELMEDEEDILEAGIRIIAQPPGKKLQNMMMLSGGEKALTAIALLFAIQNLKPSPFCLLDEIEAALDESNVGRFAGYLNKLTEHTQFIVITHRRGTMEKADRLYGITMQEKGVSALVSVNLIDKDLDD